MKLFIATLLTLSTFSSFAGDNGGGYIECSSASGRTQLKGMAGVVSENGVGNVDLEISIDKKTLSLNTYKVLSRNGEKSVDKVVFNAAKKQFSLNLIEHFSLDGGAELTEKTISVVAISKTFKKTSNDVYSFSAILNGADPRKDQIDTIDGRILLIESPITVKCTLDLSL
ncbi:MAG: hypothetical protein KBD76_12815 [Bacteriovorax sp.]|jgi:hypothetical protein|nr:hypothetical protein [Bacteriovorax sp.]